ncbi:MAG: APC family permease, partial [Clostridia bacterium]|nr:APC family permease [Clostridia bacterium]
MKKSIRILISALITLVVAAIGYYVYLPALNIYSQEFWIVLAVVALIFSVAYLLLGAKESGNVKKAFSGFKSLKIVIIAVAVPIVVLIVGNIISSTFLNAEKYANIIEVEEAVFEEDMPETGLVTNIALMDSDSAARIGDRTLGALSEVVSQYQVGNNYYQINYKGTPQKVTNLEYVDFFKWFNNKDSGVPGLVMVDPVNSSAEYIELDTPMKYVDSAYFEEDLHRKLRFTYPTKIFGNYSFELDEEGNPYYIVSCMAPRIGLFGAMDVVEVVVFDPCDGSHELYALEDAPSWIDNVFTGTLASQKYDWYGTLKNGFWN